MVNWFNAGRVPRRTLVVSTAALLAGCSLAPTDLPNAEVATPTHYSFTTAVDLSQATLPPWWEAFDDPLLAELVRSGLRQSHAVAAATQRIESAKANAEREGLRISPELQGAASTSRPATATSASGSGSLSVTLDLDISRQKRRDQDRALIAVADAMSARDALLLDLSGAIARGFVQYAANEERLRQLREDLGRRQALMETLEAGIEDGEATRLDLLRTRASLLDTRATLRRLEGERTALAQELRARVGGDPELVGRLAAGRGALWLRNHRTLNAIPADLVRARPDIRRIELQYDAARVRVRDAEAERLPRLFLAGTIDASNAGLGWRFGPSISLPPLSARARDAAVEREIASAQAILFDWQSAIVSAAAEVEAAHARLRAAHGQFEQLQAAKREYDAALTIAEELFAAGEITLLELLDLEQARADSHRPLIEARTAYLTAFIDLHLALGAAPPH